MSTLHTLCKREMTHYFTTPVAWVFLVVFLMMAGMFTFYLGGFYERGQADLRTFFNFHPWLFLFLVPALSMRIWSEERRNGTIELLMTLPISTRDAVLGKFLAAWLFTCFALLLTLPIWLTVNYLGSPDNSVILGSYFGSALLAGCFIAVGCCMSALSRNQVVAFVLTVSACFILLMSGFPMVINLFQGWLPVGLVNSIAALSLLTHFQHFIKGVVELRDVLFFATTILFWLYLTLLAVDRNKAL